MIRWLHCVCVCVQLLAAACWISWHDESRRTPTHGGRAVSSGSGLVGIHADSMHSAVGVLVIRCNLDLLWLDSSQQPIELLQLVVTLAMHCHWQVW